MVDQDQPKRPREPFREIKGHMTYVANTRVIDSHDLWSPQLIDPFGRAITYLRVSVTDRCDFRCVCCMSENMAFLPKADLLSLEELDRLGSAFLARGVRNRRLTAGGPRVRGGVQSHAASRLERPST